jgi:hypothetical protein
MNIEMNYFILWNECIAIFIVPLRFFNFAPLPPFLAIGGMDRMGLVIKTSI